MSHQVIDLARTCAGESTSWESIIRKALIYHRTLDLAVYANIGIDMTTFARDLIAVAPTCYHPFLERCSSQHGRLSLMQDIPDIDHLLKAPPVFVEDLLKEISNPLSC